jgi:hypothetical protein
MIGFFRRIRKKLADDNQFLKYSRYAVGEIVLVMIGILLALQVNNWNEERKTRQKERKILLELKDNLEESLQSFQYRSNVTHREIRMIDRIFYSMDNNVKSDSLVYWMKWALIPVNIPLTSTAFESLKIIGYDLIQSDTLREEIIRLFDIIYPLGSRQVALRVETELNAYNPYLNEYITRDATSQIYQMTIDNFPKMRQDRLFKNTLWSLRSFRKHRYLPSLDWWADKCQNIIDLIDNELNK